ncbi:hypothetical protein DSO57_1018184 [Entomophthora muscae]|uniref:Uncharacterized protein n=1 Tax=Entomophthora muscae TaxID=34485 RepID=A0ACC2RIW3_9FUNG|nr:hypothetical protein DSO57_1018184 [Entomophthora muscae]
MRSDSFFVQVLVMALAGHAAAKQTQQPSLGSDDLLSTLNPSAYTKSTSPLSKQEYQLQSPTQQSTQSYSIPQAQGITPPAKGTRSETVVFSKSPTDGLFRPLPPPEGQQVGYFGESLKGPVMAELSSVSITFVYPEENVPCKHPATSNLQNIPPRLFR